MNFGYLSTFLSIDKGLIEKLGPTGFTLSTFDFSANFVTKSSSGFIANNVMLLINSILVFSFFFVFMCFDLTFFINIQFVTLVFCYILLNLSTSKI